MCKVINKNNSENSITSIRRFLWQTFNPWILTRGASLRNPIVVIIVPCTVSLKISRVNPKKINLCKTSVIRYAYINVILALFSPPKKQNTITILFKKQNPLSIYQTLVIYFSSGMCPFQYLIKNVYTNLSFVASCLFKPNNKVNDTEYVLRHVLNTSDHI